MNRKTVNSIDQLATNIIDRLVLNGLMDSPSEDLENYTDTRAWIKEEIETRLDSEEIEDLQLYPRRCDVTGKGITEGFVFDDGCYYCSTEEQALEIVIKDGYKDLDEAFKDEYYYYTEWASEWEDLESDGFGYDIDGNEYRFDEYTKNWYKLITRL
jgi:hypothetical protein